VLIDTVGVPRWDALASEVSDDHVHANGVRWRIERSEGNVNS
jgi:hypothetical protein